MKNFRFYLERVGILGNWNFLRFVRLALGIMIIIQAVVVKDWVMGFLGIFFTIMPLFNMGCCASGGCATPLKKKTEHSKEIIYEEVVK